MFVGLGQAQKRATHRILLLTGFIISNLMEVGFPLPECSGSLPRQRLLPRLSSATPVLIGKRHRPFINTKYAEYSLVYFWSLVLKDGRTVFLQLEQQLT